ncbi:MAG TPA: phosphate acyltransferase, partial [Longimicrobiales bacterium]|nr:phosphate acyltransferase [Longimicrobiales bacterium]
RKGITKAEARARINKAIYYGSMMVREGDADGLVAGVDSHYPETIRPALEVVGTAHGVRHVAGLYMMILQNDLLFFADTTVNIEPDVAALAEIAVLSASFVERLALEPRLAMLSFSNFGSTRHPNAEKVMEAVERVREMRPDLMIDGEMQADTAVVAEILQGTYPFSTLKQPANVLIFPDLGAANIAYKLMARIGGAEAVGPILLGMDRPIHVLQRGSAAQDVVNLTAIAVEDAKQRARQEAPEPVTV